MRKAIEQMLFFNWIHVFPFCVRMNQTSCSQCESFTVAADLVCSHGSTAVSRTLHFIRKPRDFEEGQTTPLHVS